MYRTVETPDERHRVVNVGARRNRNRWLAVIGWAVGEVLPDLDARTRAALVVEAMRYAESEGYILTRQV